MPPQGLATPRNTIATAKLAPKFLSFSEIPEPDLSEGDDDDDGDDDDHDDDGDNHYGIAKDVKGSLSGVDLFSYSKPRNAEILRHSVRVRNMLRWC